MAIFMNLHFCINMLYMQLLFLWHIFKNSFQTLIYKKKKKFLAVEILLKSQVQTQNICNLIGWNSMHISDIYLIAAVQVQGFQLRLATDDFHPPLNHKWPESHRAKIHNNNLFFSFWNNFSWKDGFTFKQW